jgi:hypothetical protein
MAALSTYGADAVLDGTPIPATLYVKLHIGNPSAAGTANPAAETTRKSFTRNAAGGDAHTENVALIEWLNAPADEDITHITAWDAVSGGNCWLVGAATNAPIQVLAGNTIQIDIGDLDITATKWT